MSTVTYPDEVDVSSEPWVKKVEDHCRFVAQELIDRGLLVWEGDRLVASPELILLVGDHGRDDQDTIAA